LAAEEAKIPVVAFPGLVAVENNPVALLVVEDNLAALPAVVEVAVDNSVARVVVS
jgi:hypothetical protein